MEEAAKTFIDKAVQKEKSLDSVTNTFKSDFKFIYQRINAGEEL